MSLTTRALAGVVFISAVAGLAAQQGGIDPNAVPVEKEPKHHLVFSNDFIRVVDARLPPGYKTLSHTHANDNVAITISPGREDAAAMARIGRAGFSKGGYSHIVTNAGTIEMRFIVVELLSGSEKSTLSSMALRIDLKPKTTEYEFIALSLLPANHCLRTGTRVHSWL